jgi:hypothetical protein
LQWINIKPPFIDKACCEVWVLSGFAYREIDSYMQTISEIEINQYLSPAILDRFAKLLLFNAGNFGIIFRFHERTIIITDYQSTESIYLYKGNESYKLISPLAKGFDSQRIDVVAGAIPIGVQTNHKKIFSLYPASVTVVPNEGFKIESTPLPSGKNKKFEPRKFDRLLENTFDLLKERSTGRKIYLMLSGGLDSHLIFFYLLKMRINFQAIVYGPDFSADVQAAKELCRVFEVPIYHARRRKHIFYQPEFISWLKGFIKTRRGQSYVNLQEIDVIYSLKNIIEKNSIILNGSTGDFLSGSHLRYGYLNWGESGIMNRIQRKFYSFRHVSKYQREELMSLILEELSSISHRYRVAKNSLEAFEKFELENRQVKYIIPMKEVYEYEGCNAFLPLWDPSVASYMLSIDPFKGRCFGRSYEKFVIDNFSDMSYEVSKISRANIPFPISILRGISKCIFFILPRPAWNWFDLRFFFYFYDPAGTSSCFKFKDFVFGQYVSDVGLQLSYLDKLAGPSCYEKKDS